MEGRPFNVHYSQKIFWGCKFKKRKKSSLDHCGRIVERCICNKVEKRPFNIHYSQKKRIFQEYKF